MLISNFPSRCFPRWSWGRSSGSKLGVSSSLASFPPFSSSPDSRSGLVRLLLIFHWTLLALLPTPRAVPSFPPGFRIVCVCFVISIDAANRLTNEHLSVVAGKNSTAAELGLHFRPLLWGCNYLKVEDLSWRCQRPPTIEIWTGRVITTCSLPSVGMHVCCGPFLSPSLSPFLSSATSCVPAVPTPTFAVSVRFDFNVRLGPDWRAPACPRVSDSQDSGTTVR